MHTLRLTVILSAVLAPLLPGVVLSQSMAQQVQTTQPVQTTTTGGGTATVAPSAEVVYPPVNFQPASTGAPSPGANIGTPGANIGTPGQGSSTPGVGINPSGTLPDSGQSTNSSSTTQNATTPAGNSTTQTGVNQPTTTTPLINQAGGQYAPNSATQTGINQPAGAATNNQTAPGATGGTQTLNGAGFGAQGATGGTQTSPNGTGLGPVQIIPGGVVTSPQSANQTPTNTQRSTNQQATPNRAPANRQAAVGNSSIRQPVLAPGQRGTLDTALLQATCAQDWQRAIRIVNTAIAAAPANQTGYRATLAAYRNRLQSLQASDVRVPNWQQQCGAGNLAVR